MALDRNGRLISIGSVVTLHGTVTAVTVEPDGMVTVLTDPPNGSEVSVRGSQLSTDPALATTPYPKLMWSATGQEITVTSATEEVEKAAAGYRLLAPGTPVAKPSDFNSPLAADEELVDPDGIGPAPAVRRKKSA